MIRVLSDDVRLAVAVDDELEAEGFRTDPHVIHRAIKGIRANAPRFGVFDMTEEEFKEQVKVVCRQVLHRRQEG